MARHTTFRYCLDPTVEQREVLARHAGAARFAFNQCLRMVKTALTHRRTTGNGEVPWTGLDLINTFNAWKKTEAAGRVFTVNSQGTVDTPVTGLQWPHEVYQQVFEEAAVDLGNGMKAWSDSRRGQRAGARVGFPRFKKKAGGIASFRLRNKHPKGKPATIRVGHAARHRTDRRARRHPTAAPHAGQESRQDLLRDDQLSRRAVVDLPERAGRRSAPQPAAPCPPRR